MKLINRLYEWYQGKYTPPPKNHPDSPIFIVSAGHYEQPFLARLLKTFGTFWLNHWKWVIGTILAIIGIIVSLKRN